MGKRWRRLDGAHDLAFVRRGGKPRWMIGEYVPSEKAPTTHIDVLWYKPVIICRSA